MIRKFDLWKSRWYLLLAVLPYGIFAATSHSNKPVSYSSQIAPIFKAQCISCHGGANPAAQLDLSTAEGVAKGGASGKLFSAGNPDESLLYNRIKGIKGDRMPQGMDALPVAQQDLIKQWIIEGGKFDGAGLKKHWAYIVPTLPKVPQIKSSWIKNPIDEFVLAQLRKEGMHPSQQAPKATLIKRVYLDVTGILPTPAQVSAFENDKSPNAYEKIVDKLLSSPHYGERQALKWLDLARYADTDGYEKDLSRVAWMYRDWVIKAYNKNMPYDQFTIDQIAGDLLPNATQDDKIATGFNRDTMQTREGGVNQKEAHFAVVEDRAETTSAVWLGSTLACAKCHDHKFDPLSQKDYYAMVAFYDNTKIYPHGDKSVGEEKYDEAAISVPTGTEKEQLAVLNREFSQAKAVLNSQTQAIESSWIASIKSPVSVNTVVPTSATSIAGQTLSIAKNGDVLASGRTPEKDEYTVNIAPTSSPISGIRLEVLPDASLPQNGPGRNNNGNFVLEKVQLFAGSKPIALADAQPDFAQDGFPSPTIDPNYPQKGWAVDGSIGSPHSLIVSFRTPVPAQTGLVLHLGFNSTYTNHVIGKFCIDTIQGEFPSSLLVPASIKAIAMKGDRTPDEERALTGYLKNHAPQVKMARDNELEVQSKLAMLDQQVPSALVMEEMPTKTKLTEFVRNRGQFTSPTQKVLSDVPTYFSKGFVQGSNRLALAKWLFNKSNPLTARVEVNRMWESYFGTGIVETSDDFGTRCPDPIYQPLLDYLAVKFRDNGWNRKAIQRLILTSATYRQDSTITKANLKRDHSNKFLARGPRFRMEAELIHDTALEASGLLSKKIGGPSVFPYQPDGVWRSISGEQWGVSKGEDQYRRGLYTFWKRTSPYPSFDAFDSPTREQCTIRRPKTNTPLQALALMNDKLMMTASAALGDRMIRAGENPDKRITRGFELCLCRPPSIKELQIVKNLLNNLHKQYSVDTKEAKELGGTEKAEYTMLGNVLLNLDETITKE